MRRAAAGQERSYAIDWFETIYTARSHAGSTGLGSRRLPRRRLLQLCFDSNDGQSYELFLKTRAFEGTGPSHDAPVIYLGSVNDGHVVRSLSWKEAQAFLAPLSFKGSRFQELRRVIETEGGPRVDSQSS